MHLKAYLLERQQLVDQALDQALPPESASPSTIHKAMRYSLFAGGAKRLRPILCLATAEACGAAISEGTQSSPRLLEAMPLACAVECIHTYSLIHDDLPCMDNDDFRRGQPTCHKVFGEGIAVLAGDALLTIAFELVAKANTWPRYDMRTLVRELAVTAGSHHLIGGQVADLEGEGKPFTLEELKYIHASKTAALLMTSVRFGAMSANADPNVLTAVTKFGKALGLAFQIIDDILDVTQTTEKLGKSAGKDVTAKKATYPSLLGLDKARLEAKRLTEEANVELENIGENTQALKSLASYLLERDY